MAGLITRAMERVRNEGSNEITHPHDLEKVIRGTKTDSGQDVTVNRALNVGALFAGTRVICEDIGKLPFVVFRENAAGERERARQSPFWRVIHDRPSPWMTSQQFREMLTGHAVLRGNGFALPERRNGVVSRLTPIHPSRVRIEEIDAGEPVFHVQMEAGRPASIETLSHREIFWLPGYMIDGPGGVSVVEHARQTLGHALATERFGARFFGQGMKPGGVFKHPGQLSDEAYERLKTDMNDPGHDSENMILEEGLEWQQVGISNEDSQFLETRQFEVTEIARWLRIKPHKIADLSRATFSNIEQESLDHVQDTLMPWGVRWQDAVQGTVIRRDDHFAEILYDALLQTDTKTRYEAHRIAVGAPWKTRNEVRRTDNMPAIDGLDEMITPLNVSDEGGDSSAREEGNDDDG